MLLLSLLAATAHLPEYQPPITCSTNGARIVVRFLHPFGPNTTIKDFAIVQAGSIQGGEWRFVVSTYDNPPLRLSPFRPTTRRLVIDTRRQLSVSYLDGKARIVPAFPRPGRYRLVFGDSLETDLEIMDEWDCQVRVRAGATGTVPPRVEAAPRRR